jgi:hypothetical protein
MGTYAIGAHTGTHSNADNVSPFEFARSHQGPIKRTLSGCLALPDQSIADCGRRVTGDDQSLLLTLRQRIQPRTPFARLTQLR